MAVQEPHQPESAPDAADARVLRPRSAREASSATHTCPNDWRRARPHVAGPGSRGFALLRGAARPRAVFVLYSPFGFCCVLCRPPAYRATP